ncbi:hypothetical protein [Streptomyces silvisoli]|uniref:Uncharacterized protein n=1 Tax=Streptomyces silvisoli TaxID=3034235 RepID=A0ABT5ZVQ8_9ACTN|nr:hypothetical protein [Streptomyces silvisoli]MDF3293910.1 hypothetical protein [Streptomyces silvisoli]
MGVPAPTRRERIFRTDLSNRIDDLNRPVSPGIPKLTLASFAPTAVFAKDTGVDAAVADAATASAVFTRTWVWARPFRRTSMKRRFDHDPLSAASRQAQP